MSRRKRQPINLGLMSVLMRSFFEDFLWWSMRQIVDRHMMMIFQFGPRALAS